MSEGRCLVPRCHGARNTHYESQRTEDQGVPHGSIGSKPGRDVSPGNGVGRAIDRGEKKPPIAHRLPEGREDAESAQCHVGADRENDYRQHPGEYGRDASSAWLMAASCVIRCRKPVP